MSKVQSQQMGQLEEDYRRMQQRVREKNAEMDGLIAKISSLESR